MLSSFLLEQYRVYPVFVAMKRHRQLLASQVAAALAAWVRAAVLR